MHSLNISPVEDRSRSGLVVNVSPRSASRGSISRQPLRLVISIVSEMSLALSTPFWLFLGSGCMAA